MAAEYLTTRDVAQRAGISASFLNKSRIDGSGPRFRKIGRSVRYTWEDVQAWLDSKAHQSTSAYAA